MLSHVLDHFIFSSKRYTTKTKAIIFGVLSSILLFTFWWFKGAAFGISGPIAEHKGLLWRKVRLFYVFYFYFLFELLIGSSSRGIFTINGDDMCVQARGGERQIIHMYDCLWICGL